MTLFQQIITIGLCVLGTMAMRFLPFLVFSENRPIPPLIDYIGRTLPLAIFAMLIIYCFRDISFVSGSHGIPELIALGITVFLHLWRGNSLLSMAGGTAVYMILINM